MKKSVVWNFFLLSLVIVSLDASVYKGQGEFTRYCVGCHSSGQSFVAQKTSFDWEMIMENKGEQLVKFHFQSEEAKDSMDYFNSSRYKKNMQHLKDFLLEYAKDSGNVPACN